MPYVQKWPAAFAPVLARSIASTGTESHGARPKVLTVRGHSRSMQGARPVRQNHTLRSNNKALIRATGQACRYFTAASQLTA